MTEAPGDVHPEDAKLVTLAKGARARVSASEGAAVRDETGRTYASASVNLSSLQLSALQAAVAQAVAAGARGLEAVVLVANVTRPDDGGLAAVRELAGEDVDVIVVAAHPSSPGT
jgi:cytidine deaminase